MPDDTGRHCYSPSLSLSHTHSSVHRPLLRWAATGAVRAHGQNDNIIKRRPPRPPPERPRPPPTSSPPTLPLGHFSSVSQPALPVTLSVCLSVCLRQCLCLWAVELHCNAKVADFTFLHVRLHSSSLTDASSSRCLFFLSESASISFSEWSTVHFTVSLSFAVSAITLPARRLAQTMSPLISASSPSTLH